MIEDRIMGMMKNLASLSDDDQMKLLSQVDSQRADLARALIEHLETSDSEAVQAGAIYLIGRHRLAEGVGALIQRIDFEPKGPPIREPEPLWERYPAMEALIHIGRPSVPAAAELLAADDADLRRDLAAKVVRYAEDAKVARFVLEQAHAGERDPARKARLQDGLARLDKLPQ